MPDWKDHCPIDKDERPVQRLAWHDGWEYRMEHGPVFSGEDAEFMSADMTDKRTFSVLSMWIRGYKAADHRATDYEATDYEVADYEVADSVHGCR